MKNISGGICAAKGFKASGVHCGIRKNANKEDLAVIVSDKICSAAACYTQNKVKGAPIYVTQSNISNGYARAIICNSGNANTCNPNGIEISREICKLLSKELSINETDIIVASTGVIGMELNIAPFITGIPKAVESLSYDGNEKAAKAIMTTDTVLKECAVEFEIDGKICHMGAIGKGSGMINPNMATMLIFITTDVNISPEMLQKALSADVVDTFNQISVDGDTSTNDTVALIANGMAENKIIVSDSDDFKVFCNALNEITSYMSMQIAKDGEGATKLLTCKCINANTKENARKISKSIISSNLFKAAMFGEDANWGRALCAIGYVKGEFDISKISLTLKSKNGKVTVCKNAAYNPYSEEEAKIILGAKEIEIIADMNDGEYFAIAWGCDLTYDYVKINGDYRS